MIHLDTSFLVRALIRDTVEYQRLQRSMNRRDRIGISAVAWAEFLCGPVSLSVVEDVGEAVGEPAPLTGLDATLAAQLFNQAGRRRGSLQDCMIAATAIGAGVPLATCDRADFERFVPFGLVLATA